MVDYAEPGVVRRPTGLIWATVVPRGLPLWPAYRQDLDAAVVLVLLSLLLSDRRGFLVVVRRRRRFFAWTEKVAYEYAPTLENAETFEADLQARIEAGLFDRARRLSRRERRKVSRRSLAARGRSPRLPHSAE